MTPRRIKIVVAGALLAASLLGLRLIREPPHATTFLRLVNARGMPLRAVLFVPDPLPAGKMPAVVLAQPVNTPTEYGSALTRELLAEGMVVLTFDWRGAERAENRQVLRSEVPEVLLLDVRAAVAYLRSLPHVDPQRVAVAGHSAGGTLAINAGTVDPTIMAVVAIGMEADVTPTRPPNLLWALGLYDEFRTLTRMRDFFQASANTAAGANVTVGDFRLGTARRLAVSPTADHFTELQDRFLHREVVDWFNQAAGRPATTRGFWMQVRQWLALVAWLAALLAVIWSLDGLLRAQGAPWLVRLVPLGTLAFVLGMTRLAAWDSLLRKDLVQLGFVAMLVVGVMQRAGRQGAGATTSSGWPRKVLGLAALVWVSILLTLVVNNIASYIYYPSYVLWIPIFAAQHLLDFIYIYTLVYPHAIFFAPSEGGMLAPQLWVYAVTAVEVVSPGIVLGTVARLARRPARTEPAAQRRAPRAAYFVLVALFALLSAVVILRLQQGFLTADSALAAARFLLRFAVLPIVLFLGLRRLFRRRIPST